MKKTLLVALCSGFAATGAAQKHDYQWPLGSYPCSTCFYKFFYDFNTDPPSIKLREDEISNPNSSSAYCNEHGDLRAYSNGLKILNANNDLVENADSLTPTLTLGTSYLDCRAFQSCFFLEKPGAPHILYFVHMDWGEHPALGWPYRYIGLNLMLTTLDMSANNGAGKATSKNEVLMTGVFMNPAAVRHANGRDWWVMVSDADENRHYRFLLTPEGFSGPFAQEAGHKPNPVTEGKYNPGGGNTFSPSGKYYIDTNGDIGFSVFKFNRCNGLLYQERRVDYPPIPRAIDGIGAAQFSPDEKLLYVTNNLITCWGPCNLGPVDLYLDTKPYLIQYDLQAFDLAASGDTVNYLDSLKFYPYAFGMENFFGTAYGPDGRLYVSYLGSSYCTVQYPNRRGKACDFRYDVPNFNNNIGFAIPNMPNYRLGPLDGSGCDTLGLDNLPVANFRADDSLEVLTRYFYDLSHHEPAAWAWDFGDGSPVSHDTSALHSFAQPGAYTVCLTVSNANGSDTFCRKIFVGVDAAAQPESEAAFRLLPNPADAELFVYQEHSDGSAKELLLMDALGRIARRQVFRENALRLDTSQLPSGLYFLQINARGRQVFSVKTVVQH